ncbi:MAG: hypothetical protein RJB38_1821 [Pseudomonadota bacterium]
MKSPYVRLKGVPRAKTRVKNKAIPTLSKITLGAIDLHCHGAFGIDLMRASSSQLTWLSKKLFQKHVAGFLPTTLSAPQSQIEAALERLGAWIAEQHRAGPTAGLAFPLGIHLEGPFIAQACCGAHPASCLLKASLPLLRKWQKLAQGKIAKITLAPESARWSELRKILQWAHDEKISISIGHSNAQPEQHHRTLKAGANSITHAWNAMPFHHRNPGLLGIALGRPDLFIEIIPDGIHVADSVVLWTQKLHPRGLCWVSDSVPAAHSTQEVSFGSLRVQIRAGAGRTSDGGLAGGAQTLHETFSKFLSRNYRNQALPPTLWVQFLEALSRNPLESLPSAQGWKTRLHQSHQFQYLWNGRLNVKPWRSRHADQE